MFLGGIALAVAAAVCNGTFGTLAKSQSVQSAQVTCGTDMTRGMLPIIWFYQLDEVHA